MRVCVRRVDGGLIEMQSDATPGTLIANAVAAGYKVEEVEERECSEAEYIALLPAPKVATPEELEASCKAALSGGDASVDPLKLVKAVALWQAQLHGKTAAQARDEIAAIYKGLA